MRIDKFYYGGYGYRVFSWKYLWAWFCDYRNNSVVKCHYTFQLGTNWKGKAKTLIYIKI